MNIRYLIRVGGVFAAALLAMPGQALAACAATNTAGGVICNIATVVGTGPVHLLSAVCYLLGLYFAMTGVFKFKEHVDTAGSGGREAPLSGAIKRFVGGGMLLSSPYMASAVQGTLLAGGPGLGSSGIATGATSAADQMVVNFITDIAGPSLTILVIFGYVSAIILLIVGILRLMKTEQEGPRGPAGLGTAMTFLASGALFSFADMAGVATSTVFGSANANAKTMAVINTSVIPAADAAQVYPLIDSMMVFIMIVGLIAFMRGWFVLKAFADGNSQVTIAQALTFLIGGAMAINLGTLVNFLEASVGVSGITFN